MREDRCGCRTSCYRQVGSDFSSQIALNHFTDTIIVKLELEGGDNDRWVLIGRVMIANFDGDLQGATAKLVHDANVVIDHVGLWMLDHSRECVALQAGFRANGNETITLECNTYSGAAWAGSIIAIKVDDIQFQ